MQSFVYHTPTEIIFGRGAEDSIAVSAKKYGGSRVMLVYGGGSAVKSGLLGKLEDILRSEGIGIIGFGGAKPNPLMSHAREGVRTALDFGADMIIAIGGGSAIDTAKAIAHGAANPGTDILRFWNGEEALEKTLPVGVVLTISAAGSETSNSAVLTDGETGVKRGLTTDLNRPRFALMNPELTFTLPEYQIACGITDIMMHTLDRYFTKAEGNEFTDEAAAALLRVTVGNGRRAMADPGDYDAMSELMWCGSVSHNGLTGLGTTPDFSVHQLGHELSAMFDVAHGASLSVMWGSWAKYVLDEKPERFSRYAEKVWGINTGNAEADAHAGIMRTEEYFKELKMPVRFAEAQMGVQPNGVIDELALRCTYYGKRLVGQFKKLGKEDLHSIYRAANK